MKIVEISPPPRTIQCTCDKCGVDYANDIMEMQEFLSYRDTGGYGNTTLGDGEQWAIDLCQKCTYELLGPYMQRLGNSFQ